MPARHVPDQSRFDSFREHFTDTRLIVTARRAETLKVTCYDGDFAQISITDDRDLRWVKSVADPSRDLSAGPLGPFQVLRDSAIGQELACLLYTSPSPRDLSTSRMPSSA